MIDCGMISAEILAPLGVAIVSKDEKKLFLFHIEFTPKQIIGIVE